MMRAASSRSATASACVRHHLLVHPQMLVAVGCQLRQVRHAKHLVAPRPRIHISHPPPPPPAADALVNSSKITSGWCLLWPERFQGQHQARGFAARGDLDQRFNPSPGLGASGFPPGRCRFRQISRSSLKKMPSSSALCWMSTAKRAPAMRRSFNSPSTAAPAPVPPVACCERFASFSASSLSTPCPFPPARRSALRKRDRHQLLARFLRKIQDACSFTPYLRFKLGISASRSSTVPAAWGCIQCYPGRSAVRG